jgi:hypothetical protein
MSGRRRSLRSLSAHTHTQTHKERETGEVLAIDNVRQLSPKPQSQQVCDVPDEVNTQRYSDRSAVTVTMIYMNSQCQ